MHEAILYDKLEGGKVRCRLCPHNCTIGEGGRGICGVRENNGGILYSLVYGKLIASHVDPIEKKPLYHFLPGTCSYSISTAGCNLRCMHCQNWDISQRPKGGGDIGGREETPEKIVDAAVKAGCKSISYTYTEPTIFLEYALDTSKTAKKSGLYNVFVSNGFMSEDAINTIKPFLDADNVDLKSFSDKFYREVCGGRLEPILNTIKKLVKEKIWVEITTLVIPTLNDTEDEFRQIAEFIRDELGPEVPWHVSRFYPDYKLDSLPQTPIETIRRARDIGLDAGLKHVYAGNIPHENSENTYCPDCGQLLIERYGFSVTKNTITDGRCPNCTTKIKGVWV